MVKTNYITVNPKTPPVAGFAADVTTGKAPLTVTFTDQSTNSPTAWAWDFGDSGTSTLQNPAHTYTAAGTYTVTLTATNGDGSDTMVRSAYITATFDCGNSYSLVDKSGETIGCVALSNEWTVDETDNSFLDTMYVSYSMADPFSLTSADLAIAFTPATGVTPQYTQSFDASAHTKSYTFAIPFPSNMNDVGFLYLTAHGVVQKETDDASSAGMDVVVPQNPIYYIIQG